MEFLEAGVGVRGCENSRFSKPQRKISFKEKEQSSHGSSTTILDTFLLTVCPREEVCWAAQGAEKEWGQRRVTPTRLLPQDLEVGQQWWSSGSCSKVCASQVLCKQSVPWSQTDSLVTFFRSHSCLLCHQSRTDVWEAAYQSRSSWPQQFSLLLV